METNAEIAREILTEFLETWTVDRLQNMTLDQYVGVGDKYTFVQYVEHRTKPLGSISGRDSSKFGIWERKDPSRKLSVFTNYEKYSWPKKFPFTTSKEAFAAIKKELLFIIDAARKGNFFAIDQPGTLSNFYKWKVAYLYSGERLISIFSRAVLQNIASHFNLPQNGRKPIPVSLIQQAMMENKPFDMTIYQYSNYLFQKFAPPKEKKTESKKGSGSDRTSGHRNRRKATEAKSTTAYTRKGTQATIVTQEHNRLQEILRAKLIALYGKDAVQMEHNFVDLKVTKPGGNILYEVKSAAYASACVEEALGQILKYAFHHGKGEEDAVELYVAGKYPPNQSDAAYIAFVTAQLNIRFGYMAIE